MRRPGAMLTADHERWHYTKPLDPSALIEQYEVFSQLVEGSGAEIIWLDDTDDGLSDSVFTYDPSFGVPGRIEEPGVSEGGDCFWLDATTLAAGRGFRTNQAGIDQMAAIVAPLDVTVESYDLPCRRYGVHPARSACR